MDRAREALKDRLEIGHGLVGHPKAERLFELAWEYGHSAGEAEVRGYYSDLVDLVDRHAEKGRSDAPTV